MSGGNIHIFYRGRSMAGTFRPGDRLTMIPVSWTGIRPGDVVVYRRLNHAGDVDELVHRVIATVPGGLVLRGDNNVRADVTLATADNLLGQVTHVERKGKTYPVRGGRWGLVRAQILRARRAIWRLIRRVGRKPYRWLRGSGLVAHLWRPTVVGIRVNTEAGPVVKYVCGGRVVARWWPAEDRFECQKPYNLVLRREDLPGARSAEVERTCPTVAPSRAPSQADAATGRPNQAEAKVYR